MINMVLPLALSLGVFFLLNSGSVRSVQDFGLRISRVAGFGTSLLTPNQWLPRWAGLSAIVCVGVAAGSPALAIAGPLVWLLCSRQIVTSRARRRAWQEDTELLAVVDQMSQELRSGSSLANAFAAAITQLQTVQRNETARFGDTAHRVTLLLPEADTRSALAVSLDRVSDDVLAGERLEVALNRLLDRQSESGAGATASPETMRLLAVAVSVLVESGGPATVAIDRLAEMLRSRRASMIEVRTQASQATASAAVLAGLPILFGMVLAVADPAIATFYVSSVGGAACIVVALTLVAVGWYWIETLVWK